MREPETSSVYYFEAGVGIDGNNFNPKSLANGGRASARERERVVTKNDKVRRK